MPLDPNLQALLGLTVSYQKKTGTDKYGQEEWSTGVDLNCYVDYGVRQVERPGGVVYTSMQTLFFDASDTTVQGFELGDRFTAPGIAGGQTLEAVEISPAYSPGPSLGEPMTAWLVEVVL